MTDTPSHAMIVGDDGIPTGVVDFTQIQSEATILMYTYAAAAGNDDDIDAAALDLMRNNNVDSVGYINAAALSLMVRCVVAPMLETIETLAPALDFRAKLAESRDNAIETLR
ncbi:hypothetical protein [Rhodococcoides fascians]|uniref:hypothetical protein n=1 Tax=Rhodococcoides fascians TaxID=1828 RepID=UPI00055FE439|nr:MULTISPECIES: hypothetical protein [Rhodococcus]OZF00550.1 hypothetical protein CH301_12780 [Rhodococcus sp. 15-1189-1-1a]OZF14429.1 hypothetical protein CH299_13460 [Rhodococcus sp. 14-2686-1-2]